MDLLSAEGPAVLKRSASAEHYAGLGHGLAELPRRPRLVTDQRNARGSA